MPSTLKAGASGQDVKLLQQMLSSAGFSIIADGVFGAQTTAALKAFQNMKGLTADGIAGPNTWAALQEYGDEDDVAVAVAVATPDKVTYADLQAAAARLGVETAALQAVQTVETGGRSGFLSNNKPVILFEGHIFWKQLQKRGIDPQKYVQGNEDILYPTWTKAFYKGGIAEYTRLDRAIAINREAALSSTSWGLFQIMGFNYQSCGYGNVTDYVNAQYKGESEQLFSFVNFLLNGSCYTSLRSKDWAGFARCYNGPSYAQNKYDVKLQQAYDKYKVG
jgi:methylmalonyl-CoA mutase cobalamin-binding subunit